MATSEESAPHSSDDVKVEPVKAAEENDTESSEDTSADMKAAIKISRQFMILLEDYRYLMSCYEESCGCHVNFDYQYFSKKLEEKYTFLSNLSSNNPLLLNALDDNSDIKTLTDLWDETQKGEKRKEQHDTEQGQYIKRIKVTKRHQQSSASNNNNDSDDTDDDTIVGLTKYQSDRSQIGHLNQDLQAYRCTKNKCDYIAFSQEDVIWHITNHDGTDTSKKEDKSSILYVCAECSKEFAAQKYLTNHVENVHSNSAKIYACDIYGCSYTTKFRTCYDEHQKRHRAIREFKCTWEGCTSAFVTKRDMFAHINFSHKQIKNYACSWPNCTATFKDSNRLKHHHFTHTGERPYICDIDGCRASFKQMPHLHKHRKTHTDEF
ncbi:PREDICTED: zinc finger protein GLI4-like [Rhagoletis zephyria]|uniref:zinc finger protein GLI4-like n=1 Tax=Rhagoletis zephyria TaxID=28612 RepID=UPI0008116851|nr:PREDICTED: zinc finger protein GLI4-like [Rhagoletis zephyria]KAH9408667.1 hypothetical protein TYRP_010935 [Tyrophagus putrescentiae]